MAYTWTITNVVQSWDATIVDWILNSWFQAWINVLYSTIITIFNFLIQPAVLSVAVALIVIYFGYGLVRKKMSSVL